MTHPTPEDRTKQKETGSIDTGTRRKNRFPRRTAWVTAAVLSSLGIAWGAPVVPTSSGLQTLQEVYDYENSQLTKDYNQLFSVSQPSARRQLSAQEIAWIQEKRAACGTVAKAQQSTQGLGCLIQYTDQRIVQIRQQEYGPGSNGSPAASPTTSTTAPTASTTSAVFLAPCPTPGTSASGGINWNSMQSIEQYFKTHETAAPHPTSAACPAGSCCVKTSELPEQQAAQTQCTPAAAPTASTKSCNPTSANRCSRTADTCQSAIKIDRSFTIQKELGPYKVTNVDVPCSLSVRKKPNKDPKAPPSYSCTPNRTWPAIAALPSAQESIYRNKASVRSILWESMLHRMWGFSIFSNPICHLRREPDVTQKYISWSTP